MTGVVIKQTIKCGTPGCKCNRGKPHKWYYYLFYRQWDGARWKMKKEYVPRKKVKALRRKIRRWKNRDREEKRCEKVLEELSKVALRALHGDPVAMMVWEVRCDEYRRTVRQLRRRERRMERCEKGYLTEMRN